MSGKDSLYTALFEIYHDSLKNFCISKGVRPEDIDEDEIVRQPHIVRQYGIRKY